MARLARLVVPGLPHLVTQRGNRGAQTFFEDDDYDLYRHLLSEAAAKAGSEIWAYCLMPNHVHLLIVPGDEDGLRRTFADAHRRYTNYVNTRQRVTGHLWRGRFGSVVMDEDYLFHAVRYISRNPVRAKLARSARAWRWSSVKAHLSGKDDDLVKVKPVLERYGDFAGFLKTKAADEAHAFRKLRQAESTGRPIGSNDWLEALEQSSGRELKPKKRGPKPRQEADK